MDAGGGWGRFVWLLTDHYQVSSQQITLTDLSEGMLQTASTEAEDHELSLTVACCDIEALPFADQQYDIVMANKVLYHLQDIPKGIRELARVLKPDGTLLASTNSEKIAATIITLHYQAMAMLEIPFTPETPSTFSMENGGDLLQQHFRQVESYYFEDETLIYDASEIRTAYETIGRYRNLLPRDDIPESAKQALPTTVGQLAQAIIDRDGVLRSPTLMGVFVCHAPILRA